MPDFRHKVRAVPLVDDDALIALFAEMLAAAAVLRLQKRKAEKNPLAGQGPPEPRLKTCKEGLTP